MELEEAKDETREIIKKLAKTEREQIAMERGMIALAHVIGKKGLL